MWGQIIGAGMSALAGAAANEKDRQNQQDDNRENFYMQLGGQKQMADYNKENALDIWNKTNYPAQVEKLKEAGLNPALLYGNGGGGGATTSGGSGGGVGMPSATRGDTAGAISGMGMMAAQLRAVEANTEVAKATAAKTEAETDKLKGVDTEKASEETRQTKFTNDLNDLIGKETMLWKYTAESEIKEIEASRANGEWEAYKAAAWKGKTFDDPNSPIAKALAAGWDKAVTDLENAKKDGNIKEAETIVKRFEANMAEKGLDPKAPWYTKFIADLLEKVGVKLF